MPKTRELTELFRAIGSHEFTRAVALARSVAEQYSVRGQFQAERELLAALSGNTKNMGSGHKPSNGNLLWNFDTALMQLVTNKSLDQIELPEALRAELYGVVKEWKFAEKLAARGIPRRWRLLFHGPSGCGKSLTATTLATASGLPAFLVRFDSLIGSFLGQTALRLREIFRFVQETPCVLIFDEVDALAKKRGNPMEVGELDRIVIAFMQELEHASSKGFIVATSNLPEALDTALWRRFDVKLQFPKPTSEDLAKFGRKHAAIYGFTIQKSLLKSCCAAASFAEAEQIVIAEARNRVLAECKS